MTTGARRFVMTVAPATPLGSSTQASRAWIRHRGTEVVVQYAFGSLGLPRLELAVLELNERAIRCYKRCGFREVGRSWESIVIDGEPHHDVLMEVTPAALLNRG